MLEGESKVEDGGVVDVPLSLNEVFSLAAPFITSCPSTNPTLPVKAFPALTLTDAKPGQSAEVSSKSGSTDGMFVAFYSGLSQTFVAVEDGKVAVPGDLLGTVYAVLTNSNSTASDSTIQAGPAILAFAFNSSGSLLN
eukprot:GHVO01004864.1.p1 GENE.GHVO01004864.1~~GHVO01004864.1.p1  ORF type:complete len:138 (+),score=17.95 GHVO01004864.1:203-616(+)